MILQVFSSVDGGYLRAYRYKGRVGVGAYSAVNGTVVFPARELGGLTSVALWRYPGAEIEYVVALPDEYVRSAIRPDGYVGRFAAFNSRGSVVAWPDTIMSAMGGLNQIYLSTWDGELVDTLDPPKARRRGVPEDIQQLLDSHDFRGSAHEVSSGMEGLYRLADGTTVVFHHDATLEGEQPLGTITADVYVTVISSDRESACVDGLVPHFKEMRPIHTVTRDTIFFLDRRLNEVEEALESWVRMYRIDTSACTWLDMD